MYVEPGRLSLMIHERRGVPPESRYPPHHVDHDVDKLLELSYNNKLTSPSMGSFVQTTDDDNNNNRKIKAPKRSSLDSIHGRATLFTDRPDAI